MSIKKVTALVMSAGILLLQTMPALACAPAFPEAVMFNTLRPDLPLKAYAAGNLGIIQAPMPSLISATTWGFSPGDCCHGLPAWLYREFR